MNESIRNVVQFFRNNDNMVVLKMLVALITFILLCE